MSATIVRQDRNVALPDEMQGRWVSTEDPSSVLVIEGGEITCYGSLVDYDYKEVSTVDDTLTVTLKVEDDARKDEFERSNITGLAIDPDGEFLVFNVKFGDQFIRP